jgi:hypothetical protein
LRPVWIEKALGQLASLREPSGGWAYQPGNAVAVEPTVLASFALASENEPTQRATVKKAAQLLASMQQDNGAMGVTSNLPSPSWATPYGILLWAYLDSYESNRERAVTFLLAREGRKLPKSSGPGHDTTLTGWPWVSGTHSWLEPTTLSILALAKAGHTDHPRVDEAVRLVHDRALSSGGWNHGNTVAFGTELRAQPGPTGLALLALASANNADPGAVERGSEYLIRSLPKIRSPRAVGWGILGLSAWEMGLESTSELLEECYSRIQRGPAPMDLALLILAAGNEPKRFFI